MMDWIKDRLIGMFAPKYIGAIVRSLLLFASGYLVKIGIPQQQIDEAVRTLDPILVGVLTSGITLLWSFIQKSKQNTVEIKGPVVVTELPPAKTK